MHNDAVMRHEVGDNGELQKLDESLAERKESDRIRMAGRFVGRDL